MNIAGKDTFHMRLEGQVVVVTGGAGGIGQAVVRRLAGEGARVAVADLDLAAAERVAGELGQHAVEVDVASVASVREMIHTAEAALGPIDVLVNNAGWDRIQPFVDTDEAFWDRVLAINLKGQIACAHAVLPGMLERRRGRIIGIASDAGRVGSSGEVVYSAAKGGVIAFTKALAREVARFGIRVNAVAPGPADTPFLKIFSEQPNNERIVEAMVRATPLKRLATPEDVAGVVLFLASDDAAFMTGQTVSVSGGLTML
jgi:2-hydroxycyclohexanecarboxyl-CoA dehydrogenase